jgi:tetratricopeptide (TPR) repeat protein
MKRNLIFLLTFSLINVYSQTFDELTSSASKAAVAKEYRKAISLFNEALLLDSENHYIYNELSLMFYHLDNIDSAIIYSNLTLRQLPGDTIALYQRAHCYLENGEFQKSLDDFTLVFREKKIKNSDACFNIGKCYAGMGKIEDAMKYYQLTLSIEPDDKYSFYELGYCYATLSTPDKENALKYYTKAIEQDHNYYEAYFNRGLLYAVQFENSQKGHADLERSIELRPRNKLSYLYNGMLYRDDEDFTRAKDIFSKVIEIYPDYGQAYFERAMTWYQIGVVNMICKDLEKAELYGYEKAAEAKRELCK